MVKSFENKNYWALILGGSSGLGLASAKKLAEQGCNIIIVHRNSKADMLSIEHEFKSIRTNGVELISFNKDAMSSEKREIILKDIVTQLGESGKIRLFLHSIAKGNLKPMVSSDGPSLQNDDLHLTLENMAISLYDWTKLIFNNHLFSEDARVISFTSQGNHKAWKGYAAVSAAKAALEAITRNIALEFAPFGIRANCIQAGVTDTASFRMIPGAAELKERSITQNPFNRLTTPEDIANIVYLLSKDEAAWINGTTIIADGGEHIH